ncbi:phage tail tube protein [Chromobacterium piscinae]|uniref:phage tail tube protein n=1 Tax=Chromobacterium piscinae TaxID=686831 RepID=UPI001C8C9B25|nr:hypothetical protein [Chromobacterium vaccinii]
MPSNAISAQGSKLSIMADGKVYTQIKEIQSFSGFDGKATELDATNLDSTAKEKRKGLQDNGGFQFEVNRVLDDPGQLALEAAKSNSQPQAFKLELPNGKAATFSALVMSFDLKGGVDAMLKGSATLSISGAVTWA